MRGGFATPAAKGILMARADTHYDTPRGFLPSRRAHLDITECGDTPVTAPDCAAIEGLDIEAAPCTGFEP